MAGLLVHASRMHPPVARILIGGLSLGLGSVTPLCMASAKGEIVWSKDPGGVREVLQMLSHASRHGPSSGAAVQAAALWNLEEYLWEIARTDGHRPNENNIWVN